MNGKCQATIVAVAAWVLVAQGAPAGSLVEQQLAGIRHLRVEVLAPRYEPLPGLPPEDLEESLEERVREILEQHDLRSVESSQQELVLEVRGARSATKDKTMALLVILELREPAVLTREWASGSDEHLIVTSWREVLLGATSSDKTVEEVFELVNLATTRFAEEVKQARSQ